jgi:HSP20 family protein
MLPTRYDPFFGSFSPFLSLRREMDRLFSDFMRDVPQTSIEETDVAIAPRLDLVETGEGYQLQADLPGVDAKDVKVNVMGNTLTIEGEKKEEREEGGGEGTTRFRERVWRRYQRSITLPESVDASKIQATLRNGVLLLRVPKSEAAKPRQIEVKAGTGAKEIEAGEPRAEAEKKKKVA